VQEVEAFPPPKPLPNPVKRNAILCAISTSGVFFTVATKHPRTTV
jgi:hypothetical protein